MAEKPNIKELAKELYLKGFSLERIAEILNKNVKTIKNYKSQNGDWDELKAASYLNKSGEDKQNIYQNFIEEMRLAVKVFARELAKLGFYGAGLLVRFSTVF